MGRRLLNHWESSSLTGDNAGTRSQTTLIETRNGQGQQCAGHAPEPGPEDQGNKNDHGIEREAAPQQDRGNEVRFQKVEQQIPGGRRSALPQDVSNVSEPTRPAG